MKATIMAAGSYREFDRKSIVINNETLIQRIIRQLKQRHVDQISITASYIGQHKDIEATEILNLFSGKDLGCLYGIKNESDIYLYADVFYSNDAMNKIVEGKTTYYGRVRPTPIKKYGEFFAFRNDPVMWDFLEKAWQSLQQGKINRLWSWDLYAYHTGKWKLDEGIMNRKKIKREQYLIIDNFTEINDCTDDFDSEEDLKKWIQHFGETHD